MDRLDPTVQELKPFTLTKAEFRIMTQIYEGAQSSDGFPAERAESLAALEARRLIVQHLAKWQLTPQGKAILRAIYELLGP